MREFLSAFKSSKFVSRALKSPFIQKVSADNGNYAFFTEIFTTVSKFQRCVTQLDHLIDGHADVVDEAELHARQLSLLVPIHHVERLEVQLLLLKVTLLKELIGQHVRHLNRADWNCSLI